MGPLEGSSSTHSTENENLVGSYRRSCYDDDDGHPALRTSISSVFYLNNSLDELKINSDNLDEEEKSDATSFTETINGKNNVKVLINGKNLDVENTNERLV